MANLEIRELRVLLMLLEERHISRAADRLGLTQSAVSKVLARLRDVFDDALLVRATGGYQLTHHAVAIEPKVRALLEQLEALDQHALQRPQDLEAEFRLSMEDDLAMMVLPIIQQKLAETAPNISLTVTNSSGTALQDIKAGKVDLLIEDLPTSASGVYTQPLFDWDWCCLMGRDHALADQSLSLQAYAGARHGLVSFSGDRFGTVDETFGKLDLKRSIPLVLPYFSSIPYILPKSGLIFTVPQPVGRLWAEQFDLVIKPVPKELDMRPLKFGLIWSRRNQNDRLHTWFRSFLMEVLSS